MPRRKSITSREITENLLILGDLCADPASPVQTPVDGFTYEELAYIIGCSETALRKTAARAILKIRSKHADLIKELNPNK